MKNFLLNKVILRALSYLSKSYSFRNKKIDYIFKICLKKLYNLGANKEDVRIRLFALAIYCQKTYSADFQDSRVNKKFSRVFKWDIFEKTAYYLIEKDNCAIIVFWVVLRNAYKNHRIEDKYRELEEKMRLKAMEMGIKRKQMKENEKITTILL